MTSPPAAVNIGDPYGRRLADELDAAHRAPLVTFGLRPEAEVRAERLELGPHGSTFTAAGMEIATRLPGVFNVENVLGAVAGALLLDVDEDAIVEGIGAVTGVAGRFEAIDEGQDFAVVVDYSHKPDALAAVLRAARALGDGRLTVVFGAGGDRDRIEATRDGACRAAARGLRDRDERQPALRGSARDHRRGRCRAQERTSRSIPTGVRRSRRRSTRAEAGDVVVIAGKGHEQGQEIAGVVHPFDDREVARAALRALTERA